MNACMGYRFSGKTLLWILVMFSFVAKGQGTVYMSVYQNGDSRQWALDLAQLTPGESIYLLVSDTSQLDSWVELNGQTLGGLFDYAMPRYTLNYDSFDCLERTLITKPDSTQDLIRGAGEIMGLPGSPIKRPLPARGNSNNLEFYVLNNAENQGLMDFLSPDQFVVEIRLNEFAKKEKRVLLFLQESLIVPNCFERVEEVYMPLSVHLFAMDDKGSILPKTWSKKPATLVLPPEVMEQRRSFQDTLLNYWSRSLKSILVYSWDIGLAGGDKCSPCMAPPPDFTLLESMGMDSMTDHLFVSYMIFPPGSSRELKMFAFEPLQWIFEMNVPAKGFLNCDEAVLYRAMVQNRQKLEKENLNILLGEGAGFFLE